MLDRQKRLNEVYEYLHDNFGIHTKGDFADRVKYARAYISSALNGNDRYLTDKLFTNICDAFPGVFNVDYLLNGEGTLLTLAERARIADLERAAAPQPAPQPSIDPSSMVNAIIASNAIAISAKDETIAALQREIKTKDDVISDLRTRLHSLEASLTLLRHQPHSPTSPGSPALDLSLYPFPVGAADAEPAHPSTVSPQS